MPVQRLARTEYTNTVRWLIGHAPFEPGVTFSPETGSDSGFLVAPQNVSAKDARDLRESAEKAAGVAVRDLKKLTGCDAAALDEACATGFIKRFGRRAWRRPLSEAETEDMMKLFQEARQKSGLDPEAAMGVVIASFLQSPHFLFKWEIGDERLTRVGDAVGLTRYQLSSRLAFLLTSTAPDEALIADVDSGRFTTPQDLLRVFQRLIENKAALSKVYGDFHMAWLEMRKLADLRKDTKKYKYWEPQLALDLETEFRTFVDAVLVKGDGKLSTLLNAPFAFANERTAKIYGVTSTGSTLKRFDLPLAQRRGILLQAPFLAVTGGEADSLAPRRGEQVWKHLLCGEIPQPPMDIPKLEPVKPDQTTRQRFEEQHDKIDCARACHGIIDPIGFAFENFGGAGDFRSTDNGQPVNAAGKITTPLGTAFAFSSGVEFAETLAVLPEMHRCAAAHWFRYVTGRRELESERTELDAVAKTFSDAQTQVIALLEALTQSRAFRLRSPAEGELL